MDCQTSAWWHALVLLGYMLMSIFGAAIGSLWWAAASGKIRASLAMGLCAICGVAFGVGVWCVWTFG